MNTKSLIVLSFACFFTSRILSQELSKKYAHGREIQVIKDDINQQSVDCIVNAANKELLSGGGVCGAIFRAAGIDALQKACFAFPKTADGVRCPVGEARVTPSFNLATRGIKHIIHAVGPDCRSIIDPVIRKNLLVSTYINSLREAEHLGAESIAFPCISTSIYAYPKKEASVIAFQTVSDFITNQASSLKKVCFMVFEQEDYVLYKQLVKTK